jgi:Sortilin, neurotensin receptor 3,
VGTHLALKLEDMNTYLTNDGGHTWMEVLKGPHVFEIGDHGGILVAASGENLRMYGRLSN